ncbi:hypothetical protein NQ317_017964 [Molorchus minor]|uniref:folate gamma-glutamyl hydrolase n=1 Tax=Molorchus minor TaxID=1323400 RepID=A0ABQ9JMJ1_9CUCU|nr:hypothetical protein NQ317_017964 [Molorchus minor]
MVVITTQCQGSRQRIMFKCLVITYFLYCFVNGSETPVIGILSQETYIVSHLFPNEKYNSFIAASYVKYLESAGARVIPIWIGQNEKYYKRIINYTNGILFPGGGVYFNETGGYGQAARYLYKLAVEANDRGKYYPIWGSCLGMEVLFYAALKGTDIRVGCLLRNIAIPLNFTEDFADSRLFADAPKILISSLRRENLTYNSHKYCVNEKVLRNKGNFD